MVSSMRDAASFLTRVPLHRGDGVPNMSRAVPWFAAVGAMLGAIQGGIYLGLHELATPALAAAVATALVAMITGAFHHDGLADMADAFGGGWTKEQRLEILKDSRLGTYGVTALVFVILIEVTALASLSGWTAIAATTVSHAVSRACAALVMTVARPAQNSGLGVDYLQGLNRTAVRVAAALSLLLTAALFGIGAVAITAAAVATAAAVVRLSYAKIDGISGDVLGAVQQLAKLACLTTIVILVTTVDAADALYALAM